MAAGPPAERSRLPALLALTLPLIAVFGWAGAPVPLGISLLAALALALAIGWRGALRRGVVLSIAGIFVVFAALMTAIALLEDPLGEPRLWLGLPASTAVLVYGVWPLGVLPSLLYAARFRGLVLPEEKLRRFLAQHSRHRE